MKVRTYVWDQEFPFWGPKKGFLARKSDKDKKETNICITNADVITYVYSDTIEDYDGFGVQINENEIR
jgi:hypothetical protein